MVRLRVEDLAYKVSFSGAKFLVEGSYLYLNLYSGPFFKAYRDYNWEIKSPALGCNKRALYYAREHNLKIRVIVLRKVDRCYEVGPDLWIVFAETTKSINRRNGIPIYLLPWSYFKTVHGDFSYILKRLGNE